LPTFGVGWLADYADIHDYAFAYLDSSGSLAEAQRYSNPTADALLNQAIRLPDGPARQAVYSQCQAIYFADAVSYPILATIGRGYMRDWVCGHYYNPLYPGIYAYNHWKWNYLKGDVNCDAKVDLGDVTTMLKAYGSWRYGTTVHPRWNFYCDILDSPALGWCDSKIDKGDFLSALPNMGQTSSQWTPPP
jgi:hypothetical protein